MMNSNVKERYGMFGEPHYSTQQAASYYSQFGLPVSRQTLERWRSKGVGPSFVRIGSRVFYPQSSLKEFIESAAVAQTQIHACF
jgi:hypothetical protein